VGLRGQSTKARNDTEVPRRPLLKALEEESDLSNTSNPKQLKSKELCLKVDIVVGTARR
jgi:hypothetical protein